MIQVVKMNFLLRKLKTIYVKRTNIRTCFFCNQVKKWRSMNDAVALLKEYLQGVYVYVKEGDINHGMCG